MDGKISAHGDQRKARMKRRIFSELGGFVVYEPALLARYLDEHGLASGDVLAYFTQTEYGGAVTEEGITVPYWASAAIITILRLPWARRMRKFLIKTKRKSSLAAGFFTHQAR